MLKIGSGSVLFLLYLRIQWYTTCTEVSRELVVANQSGHHQTLSVQTTIHGNLLLHIGKFCRVGSYFRQYILG